MSSFYSESELAKIGFEKIGENVQISRFVQFYSPDKMEIGSNVRIDDFCILSGDIKLGDYIHIAAYSGLYGRGGIVMKDFSSISSRVSIYSSNDDYSGGALTNPTVPEEFRNAEYAKVIINKHCIIGSGTVILPGVEIGEGTAVGSMSLCNKDIEEWSIYAGIPAKYIKKRKKDLLIKERELKEEIDKIL